MEESNREHSEARYPFHKARMEAPTLRLAHVPGAQGDNCLMGRNNSKKLPASSAPSLLVSYFYLQNWLSKRHLYVIRDWVLDSGAFSARQQNISISLTDYIETCKRLIDTEDALTEIYALDVIGDVEGWHPCHPDVSPARALGRAERIRCRLPKDRGGRHG